MVSKIRKSVVNIALFSLISGAHLTAAMASKHPIEDELVPPAKHRKVPDAAPIESRANLFTFPVEIITTIFGFLDPESLKNLRLTCKAAGTFTDNLEAWDSCQFNYRCLNLATTSDFRVRYFSHAVTRSFEEVEATLERFAILFPKLQELTLEVVGGGDYHDLLNLEILAKLGELRRLTMISNYPETQDDGDDTYWYSAEQLVKQTLDHAPKNLEHLSLEVAPLQLENALDFSRLSQLKTLTFATTGVRDTFLELESLAPLQNLEDLTVDSGIKISRPEKTVVLPKLTQISGWYIYCGCCRVVRTVRC